MVSGGRGNAVTVSGLLQGKHLNFAELAFKTVFILSQFFFLKYLTFFVAHNLLISLPISNNIFIVSRKIYFHKSCSSLYTFLLPVFLELLKSIPFLFGGCVMKQLWTCSSILPELEVGKRPPLLAFPAHPGEARGGDSCSRYFIGTLLSPASKCALSAAGGIRTWRGMESHRSEVPGQL